MTRRGGITLLMGALALMVVASSCAGETGSGLESGERTIHMAAIEPKGEASADEEPFPTDPLPAGGGYVLEEPDAEGNWVVETYRWLPSEVTVVEGDKVTMEILGVNGASHPSTIEGYGLDFEVKRGQVTTVQFTADKPGIFRFVCQVHQPTMTGSLIVLPA